MKNQRGTSLRNRFRLWLNSRSGKAHRVMYWSNFIGMAVILVLIFIIINGRLQARTAELNAEETTASIQLAGEQSAAVSLQDEIDYVASDAYTEQEARIQLHYISPGEIRFTFTNPEALKTETEAQKARREELTR